MSSTRADDEAVCGWNNLAVAERVEFKHIEESLFWRFQRARFQFSLSSLLHPAKISLASETLTHHTLHLAGYPIQLGMSAIALLAMIVEEACPRVGLLFIEGQHMASHVQVHASTTGIGAIDSINYKINTVGVILGGGVHAQASLNFHPHL